MFGNKRKRKIEPVLGKIEREKKSKMGGGENGKGKE